MLVLVYYVNRDVFGLDFLLQFFSQDDVKDIAAFDYISHITGNSIL